ncbi:MULTISPECIES: hypothetical protein [Cytobacillus]|jgi:hypothetical protein|uniref:Uncharacterized protein n=1 Tax=Cytobacillus firmus DS1 TaxID=1307436 RepID=W7L095_CYTFI|nr:MULTISPECIES: hypothetical protein [Cytobacillus]EWG08462.1 hypothetical protein PBF_24171 [Cytobacillus firmus DS1]MCM3243166.1 hypothetical protein [Cytobacillus oceanisediminis]MDK7665409.1 hypothetical protein [Cytobacillus oceanisediminis]
MSNKRMALSEEGKSILDTLTEVLEVDRPMGVKVALSKGLSIANGPVKEEYSTGKNKWTIPDGIIKDKEFLLFKHLIINEVNSLLTEEELHKHMLAFIEKGLREINQTIINKTSMEDLRLTLL